MIYKESTTTSNILPLIKNNQNENVDSSQNKYTFTDQYSRNTNNNNNNKDNLTLDINYISNNRYNLQNNSDNEINSDTDKDKEKENKYNYHSLTNSRNTSNEHIPYTARNPFIAKVELENIRSRKDCLYLLDLLMKKQNKECQYELTSEQDKLIFSFEDEQTAFEFTKIIYNEKNKNSLYKHVIVHMKLLPNKMYLKKQNLEKKKKGISLESIMKLYNGSSYTKKPKEFPKIYGNINFGLKSPFYNVNDHKKKKINSFKTIKTRNYISRNNNNGDIYGYVGYDGLPLKSYNKLRISVLDTHYNPFSNYKYREDNKKKWVSPSNFKYY